MKTLLFLAANLIEIFTVLTNEEKKYTIIKHTQINFKILFFLILESRNLKKNV